MNGLTGALGGGSGPGELLRAIIAAFRPGLSVQEPGSFWLPSQASTTAGEVDSLFYFIFWLSVFFFVLIVGVMLLFVLRYRQRRDHEVEASATHNLPLEVVWTIIPIILVVVIFVWGFKSYLSMSTPPQNSYEILVTGQKWKWFFTYPNGYVSDELHVPVDENIRLVMTSEDVIHSLYIPAFRLKKDVVPGRYSKAWFRATETGQHPVLCAEFCGTGHSDMLTWCVVHEVGGFETWMEKSANFLDTLTPAEGGERLYLSRGCKQCHSVDGAAGIGPTFLGLFGKKHPMKDGTSVLADENYIRESILEPQAKIVAGFEPVMPTYQGKFSDREITAVIEYLKTLAQEQ